MSGIRLAEFDELEEISRLMQNVFVSRMQDLYDNDAKRTVSDEISLSALQKRFFMNSIFYVDVAEQGIQGVLELEPPGHIAFLFVKMPGKGIARSLCDAVFKTQSMSIITVGAFPPAVGFYTKLGFTQISRGEKLNYLPFVLMAKKLS